MSSRLELCNGDDDDDGDDDDQMRVHIFSSAPWQNLSVELLEPPSVESSKCDSEKTQLNKT